MRFTIQGAKGNFFDSEKVLKAVDRATRKVLSKFGAFVRRTARASIRKAKKVSLPGEPPKGKTDILRKFLFFVFDPITKSVVIGPAKTNQVFKNSQGRPVKGTVPQVLEEGGSVTQIEWQSPTSGKWWRADLRYGRNRQDWKRRSRTIRVAARPYMVPALQKELPGLPALWHDSVKPG